MKNKIKIFGFVILILIIIGIVYHNRTQPSSKETIRIIKPHIGDIRITVSSPGTVLPKNRLEIKPPVNGRIDKVLVQEGQKVKSGEIMAWMSSTDRAALLDAARGQGEKTLSYWQDVYKSIPLIAPIDGEVIVGTIQPGQTVTAADSVVVLSDRLIVRGQVDETDIGKIKVDQAAIITLDAYPDVKINSKVDHIYYESKTVNNVTVYEVDLNLQEVPDFFRSGMNTNVNFIIENKENLLLVPLEVIQRHNGKTYVNIQREDKKELQESEVILGIADENDVEILSGIQDGDEIVMKKKKYSVNKQSGGTNPFMPSRSGNTRRQ